MNGLTALRPNAATVADAASGQSTGIVDVLLVCTPGGHLAQLSALRGAWEGLTTAWVTGNTSDARSLLRSERVYYGFGPAERSIVNFVRNLRLARRLIRDLNPSVVVSTGAAMSVPFIWVARLSGAKVFYVESITRVDSPSLTCRLVNPFANRVYVQWPELAERVPGAQYVGSVFSVR